MASPYVSLWQRVRNAGRAFRAGGTWTPQTIDDLDRFMEMGGGQETNSGVRVSDQTVLTFSAVYCAVRHISNAIASMPLQVFRRTGDDTREPARDVPEYRILSKRPNDEMPSFIWREVGTSHNLLQGNMYNQIIRDGRGLRELRPMNPLATMVEREAGRLIYVYRYIDTDGAERERKLRADEVLHIPGLGFDGRKGYSVVQIARESLGLGLGAQEYAARWYGQGMRVGGFLQHPGQLNEQSQQNLKRDMDAKSGMRNSHKWLVLEEGMIANPFPTMSAEDAGFLMMLDGGVREVARWFLCPPHKLYEMSRMTFNNVEQLDRNFYSDAVLPLAVRFEQCLDFRLFPDNDELYCKFNMRGMMRADTETQAKALEIERRNGIITTDDWLTLTDRNPVGGEVGALRIVPANMQSAEVTAKAEAPMEQPPRTPEPSNQLVGTNGSNGHGAH